MATNPQHDMEQQLLRYRQKRRELAGAPLPLHPATRAMFQGEATRSVGRPLISSEEAAKNFIRSVAMFQAQPGFFLRYWRRIAWASSFGAALILAIVVSTDPRWSAPRSPVSDAELGTATAPETLASASTEAASLAVIPPPARALERKATAGESALAPAAAPFDRLDLANDLPLRTPSITPAEPLARASVPNQQMTTIDARRLVSDPTSAPGRSAAPTPISPRPAVPSPIPATPASTPVTMREAERVAIKLARSKERAEPTVQVELAGGFTARPTLLSIEADKAKSGQLEEGVQRWSFQQLDNRAQYRRNPNSPPVPDVLNNFQLELSGQRVRIVDGDGSTYLGLLVPAAPEGGLATSRFAAGAPPSEANRQRAVTRLQTESRDAGQNYYFRVSGTNQSLRERVEMEGILHEAVVIKPAQNAGPAMGLEQNVISPASTNQGRPLPARAEPARELMTIRPTAAAPTGPSSQTVQRVTGRAVVGKNHQFDIDARPK